MGTIRVKPVQNNNPYTSAYGKWFMQVLLNVALSVEDLAYHISLDSGVERSKVAEIARAIVKQIDELLCNGHAIRIPHLGLLKLSVKSKGAKTVSEFHAGKDIENLHLILKPDKEIKAELKKIKFEKFYYEDALAKQNATQEEENEGDGENGSANSGNNGTPDGENNGTTGGENNGGSTTGGNTGDDEEIPSEGGQG